MREDIHIHASHQVIREQLRNIQNNTQWLSKHFQKYRTEGNFLFFDLELSGHKTKIVLELDQSDPFSITYKKPTKAMNEAIILSITWAIHVESTNDTHLTVELFYQPLNGFLGNLRELVVLRGTRTQALRDSLWNLKQLIETLSDK